MQRYFLMLLSLAASLRHIKVESGGISRGVRMQIFDASLFWDNGTAIKDSGIEIRAYHEDDCSFFSVNTFEKTDKGNARFQLLCSCPTITNCVVTFRAKDYTDGQITLFKNPLPLSRLICKRDNNPIQLNSNIHINISLTDDSGKALSLSNITLDDSYGEEFKQKQTFLDGKNGLAEFDSSWLTAGIKLLRIIGARSFDLGYGHLYVKHISLCQISVAEEIRNMTLTLNKNVRSI